MVAIWGWGGILKCVKICVERTRWCVGVGSPSNQNQFLFYLSSRFDISQVSLFRKETARKFLTSAARLLLRGRFGKDVGAGRVFRLWGVVSDLAPTQSSVSVPSL